MTQRYVATQAAGTRQQSRFIAMMQNYERTQELLTAAKNSTGAGEAQFEKTLDSMEAKVNQLKNAWNEFTMNIMNSDFLKGAIDAATTFLDIINKVTEVFSGLPKPIGDIATSLMAIGTIMGGFALGKNIIQGDKLRDKITGATQVTGSWRDSQVKTDSTTTTKSQTKEQKKRNEDKVSVTSQVDKIKDPGINKMFDAANWTSWKKEFRDNLKLNKGDLSKMSDMFDGLPESIQSKLKKQDIVGTIVDSMVRDYSNLTGTTDKAILEKQREEYATKAKTIYEHNGKDIGKTVQGLLKTGIRQNKKLGGDGTLKLGGGRFNILSSVSEGLTSVSEKAQTSSIALNQIGTALSAAGFETAAAGVSVLSGITSGLGGIAQLASAGITKLNTSLQGLTAKEFLGKITGLGSYTDVMGNKIGGLNSIRSGWSSGREAAASYAESIAATGARPSNLKRSAFRGKKTKGVGVDQLKLFGSNGKLAAGLKGISQESTGATKAITGFLGAIASLPGPVLGAVAAFAALAAIKGL